MPSGLISELLELTLEHVWLVSVAMASATATAISSGILARGHAGVRRWGIGFANVMQTVPSLALFGFLIPLPFIGGIGATTAIVALVLYALLPIVRNTYEGIAG